MKLIHSIRARIEQRRQEGKMRTGILLWLIGVPLPVILLIWAVKGCV